MCVHVGFRWPTGQRESTLWWLHSGQTLSRDWKWKVNAASLDIGLWQLLSAASHLTDLLVLTPTHMHRNGGRTHKSTNIEYSWEKPCYWQKLWRLSSPHYPYIHTWHHRWAVKGHISHTKSLNTSQISDHRVRDICVSFPLINGLPTAASSPQRGNWTVQSLRLSGA